MAFEKKWVAVAPRLLTSDGTADGVLTLATTKNLHVKQCITIVSDTVGQRTLQINSIPSPTQIEVGELKSTINQRTDVSAYTIADNASIQAKVQARPTIPQTEHERAVFEEEPIVAKRVIQVDEFGNIYCDDNPFPVSITGIDEVRIDNAQLDVNLNHQDNQPAPGDVHDSVRIGDGTETLAINPDGSINVVGSISVSNAQTPTVDTLSMPAANTEYFYTLPTGTKQFSIKVRGPRTLLKVAFNSGDIALGTYFTVNSGKSYNQKSVNINSNLPIYFEAGKSNTTIEILYWT